MPLGKAHLKIGLLSFGVILLGILVLRQAEQLSVSFSKVILLSVSYLFSMYLLSPDLDIKSDPLKRWGVLRFIWRPYAILFKHRGSSHHFLLGTLIRLAYLCFAFVWLVLLCGILLYLTRFLWVNTGLGGYLPALAGLYFNRVKPYIPVFLIGVYVPNILHILADRYVSRKKRSRNRAK